MKGDGLFREKVVNDEEGVTKRIRIILSTRVFSSKPAISIEFNDVDSNNLAGYEERTCVLYMIQIVLA